MPSLRGWTYGVPKLSMGGHSIDKGINATLTATWTVRRVTNIANTAVRLLLKSGATVLATGTWVKGIAIGDSASPYVSLGVGGTALASRAISVFLQEGDDNGSQISDVTSHNISYSVLANLIAGWEVNPDSLVLSQQRGGLRRLRVRH